MYKIHYIQIYNFNTNTNQSINNQSFNFKKYLLLYKINQLIKKKLDLKQTLKKF